MAEIDPILLVAQNSRYTHVNLAVRSLRAYLQQHWPEHPPIECLEMTIQEPLLRQLRRILRLNARVIAFSCYIWNITTIHSLTRQLRRLRPDSLIIWGGPEAGSAAAKWLLEEPAVDFIVRGEGEQSLLELLRCLNTVEQGTQPDPRRLAAVPGLSYRRASDDGRTEIFHQPETARLEASDWPFPYDPASLRRDRDRTLYYESSRGCPFGCSYCLSSLDRQLRLRPLDQTLRELDWLIEADVRQVKLIDRTFNVDKSRAAAIWRHLTEAARKKPVRTNFHFEVAGDQLDDEAIAILSTAPPGLIQLEIGVQTAQPHVLRAINRPCDLDRLGRQVAALRQSGNVHLHLDLIAGLPGETWDQFGESFDFVMNLRPHQFQLGFLKVLPGTAMATDARRLDFAWQDDPPYEVLRSDQLSFEQLARLHDIAELIDHAWNNGLLTGAIDWLMPHWQRPWLFFTNWADLCESRGGFDRSLSPAARARLLWQFGLTKLRGREATAQSDWMARAWRDLLRLTYIESGQKDQPDWLGYWEQSDDPTLRRRISGDRQALSSSLRHLRRWRVDRVCFSLPEFAASGRLVPADDRVVYDLSGLYPVRLRDI